ncbi:MAG: outer membrane beta-barrel family protein [Muribaculaceae bacterium]|nr:outer membrane beta-barrel family protein [Muribaculaceae bacterium]
MNRFILFLITLIICVLDDSSAFCAEPQDTVEGKVLNELVVKGRQKVLIKEGTLTKVKVHGTNFSEMGSVFDMLGNIPGIINVGNGLQVAGSGTPIYYLDGRQLTDLSQLSVLQASDIKDVRIERAPGAEYPAGTKAVIFLTTYHSIRDNLFVSVINTLGIRRKVSDFPALNFRVKAGKFVTALNYTFGTSGSENRETYYKRIIHSSYVFESSQKRRLPDRDISNTVNWSGEYNLNVHNRFGLYYYFRSGHLKGKEIGENEIVDFNGVTVLDVDNRVRRNSTLHSVSGSYDYVNGSTSLHVGQDFAYNHINSSSLIKETKEYYNSEVDNQNSSHYRVATTNIRSGFALPWHLGLGAGFQFDAVNSSSYLETHNIMNLDYLNNSRLKVHEYTPQAYVVLGRRFGKFSVSPGIRYQYTRRTVTTDDLLGHGREESRHNTSAFYPFVTLRYRGKISGSIQYSRRIVHPDFNALNAGLSYLDTFTYKEGNPDLKSSIVNDLRLVADIADLSVELRYQENKNPFSDIEYQKNPENNLVYQKYVNFKKYQLLTAALSYSSSWGNLDYYGRVDLNFRNSNMSPVITDLKKRSFSVDVDINLNYQFNSRFSVYGNYVLQGHNSSLGTVQRSVQNLNFGVTAKFIRNRLSVNLEALDVLGKANYNNLYTTFQNVVNGTRGTNDMRGVRIRLSYVLFNKPVMLDGGRENTDILNRVK